MVWRGEAADILRLASTKPTTKLISDIISTFYVIGYSEEDNCTIAPLQHTESKLVPRSITHNAREANALSLPACISHYIIMLPS